MGNRFGIIIQARNNSSRLKSKMSMPFYKEHTLLEIIIERLKSSLSGIPIILATTHNEGDDVLEAMAIKSGIKTYRGDEKNVLLRMTQAAKTHQVEVMVRVCADNPFLEGKSIRNCINQYEARPSDYISYDVGDHKPSIISHFGFYAELVKSNVLEAILKKTNDHFYLEHVTNYLYTHPEEYSIQLLEAPHYIYGRNDIRLTVDTMQDFELAKMLYSNFVLKGWDHEDLIHYIDSREDILSNMKLMITANTK